MPADILPIAPKLEAKAAARAALEAAQKARLQLACVNLGIDPAILDWTLAWEEDAIGKMIPGSTGVIKPGERAADA